MRGVSAVVLVSILLIFLTVSAVVMFYYGSSLALMRSQQTANGALTVQQVSGYVRLVSAWGEYNASSGTSTITMVFSVPDDYNSGVSYIVQSLDGVTLLVGTVLPGSCSHPVCTVTVSARIPRGTYYLGIPAPAPSLQPQRIFLYVR